MAKVTRYKKQNKMTSKASIGKNPKVKAGPKSKSSSAYKSRKKK